MNDIQNPTEAQVETAEVAVTPQAEPSNVSTKEEVTLVSENETSGSASAPSYETKAQILERLTALVDGDEEITKQEMDALKSAFYRIQRQETTSDTDTEDPTRMANSGERVGSPDTVEPGRMENSGECVGSREALTEEENEFKLKMAALRDKRAAQSAALEAEREENLQKKQAIIGRIKELTLNPDEINRAYNEFKELQEQWNTIKEVPATQATALWKNYQQAVEAFYDTLKLSNELRAYDFKKNLELKTALCEAAEKLAEETDIVAAFRSLQQLHQEFREIGPVANDLREAIWTRFKEASTVINKRHQQHFEERKQREEENLAKKTTICETIEAFNQQEMKTFGEWNAVSAKITALQAEWKTIGFAPQKMNTKIFERFRAACDTFFTAKNSYFQTVRETLNSNYAQKLELVEKAEALKDSTDWKATTDALVDLQKRWKEIGTVPKKMSDQIWQRFSSACDAFFAAKKEATQGGRSEQTANMQQKRDIIAALAAIVPEEFEGDLRTRLREAQEAWNNIGHVPFKEKDKLYQQLREQMDRLYGACHQNAARHRIERFKESVKGASGSDLRARLTRQLEILRNEIKTYENNLGFLSLSSKSRQGNTLIEELNRKMDKLRSDMEEVKAKIAALEDAKQD